MLRIYCSFILVLMTFQLMDAQIITENHVVTKFVQSHPSEVGVTEADLYNIQYQQSAILNNDIGTVHYYIQTVGDIPIQNSTINVVERKNGELFISGSRAISNLETKVVEAKYKITVEEAITLTGKRLGVSVKKDFDVKKVSSNSYEINNLSFTNNTVPVTKLYVMKEELVIPVWSMHIDMKSSQDYFEIQVDCQTGELVNVHNFTLYCKHDDHQHTQTCQPKDHHYSPNEVAVPNVSFTSMIDGSVYYVYAWPTESPKHGSIELAMEPADLEASPYGWHDTDGNIGAEYTITRGNNVHAYQDRADRNTSIGDEPDGGDELSFIYNHDQLSEPIFSEKAATTNLFYQVNKMHDFTHFFGFNEVNGNFQENNYGNGGIGGDYINAEVFDGSGDNVASFTPTDEGNNARLQLSLWDRSNANLFNIQEPVAIAGFITVGEAADDPLWDFDYDTPVNGKLVLARDGQLQGGTQLCNPVDNVNEIAGNIAVVDRGTCFFSEKALNAQQGGAIACIICNVEGVNGGTGEEILTMAAGEISEPVTIPTVFLAKSACDRIRSQMLGGNDVIVNIEAIDVEGPEDIDASFDNGIIAHEFGHGVSIRLTGGSANSGCLPTLDTNDDGVPDTGEQMGEGWSDFFSLVVMNDEESYGAESRGIGTYINGEEPDDTGVRIYPYSTDMTINPQTYDDISNATVPHGVGAIWNAMIWDMYWAFVDLYGFDIDYKNTDSGNYKAIKLVIDAMMIQPCSPGFVDGRDAIMQADLMNYGGIHQCMIWEVFARRGLGYLAEQGDPLSHTDGFENFEALPTCIKELKIKKIATDLVTPGEEISVEIYYANHTEDTASAVVITDEIPDGMSYISSTASVAPTVVGNIVSWDFGDVPTLQEESFNVVYGTNPEIMSTRTSYDPISSTNTSNWTVDFLEGFNIFSVQPIFPNSGLSSWFIESVATESDQVLDFKSLTVTGDQPVLRFWQAYETELRSDGGFVMISTDGGLTFEFLADKFILNGPHTTLQFGTFAIPNLAAFSGDSEGYIASYVDLSDYVGQEVTIRFRWGSDDNTSPALQSGTSFIPGWYIDDFELLDLKTYESQACITSTSTEGSCSEVQTTIIDTGLALSTTSDLDLSGIDLAVLPNPTSGHINILLSSADQSVDYYVALYSMDGRQLANQSTPRGSDHHNYTFDTTLLTNGMYLVQVTSKNGILSTKVVLNR